MVLPCIAVQSSLKKVNNYKRILEASVLVHFFVAESLLFPGPVRPQIQEITHQGRGGKTEYQTQCHSQKRSQQPRSLCPVRGQWEFAWPEPEDKPSLMLLLLWSLIRAQKNRMLRSKPETQLLHSAFVRTRLMSPTGIWEYFQRRG